MATSSTTPSSTPSTTPSTTTKTKTVSTALQKAGLIVELSGAASFLTGMAIALSDHRYPTAALFLGAAIAVFVGQKLRKS